jgi:putative endonuclease
MRRHEYFVYILTNIHRTVLYTGVTNDLPRRLAQHQDNHQPHSFTHQYNCHYLLYYEMHPYVLNAIAREKEIKGWRREKKEQLINEFNPEWRFLNDEL